MTVNSSFIEGGGVRISALALDPDDETDKTRYTLFIKIPAVSGGPAAEILTPIAGGSLTLSEDGKRYEYVFSPTRAGQHYVRVEVASTEDDPTVAAEETFFHVKASQFS